MRFCTEEVVEETSSEAAYGQIFNTYIDSGKDIVKECELADAFANAGSIRKLILWGSFISDDDDDDDDDSTEREKMGNAAAQEVSPAGQRLAKVLSHTDKLTHLKFSYNCIAYIPQEIAASAKTITYLDMSETSISSFRILNSCFSSLRNLKSLDFSFCEMGSLIEDIPLSQMEQLETLRLEHNYFGEEEFDGYNLRHARNLKCLHLRDNRLGSIQSLHRIPYAKLESLEHLDLSLNGIDDKDLESIKAIEMPNLRCLDLSDNYFHKETLERFIRKNKIDPSVLIYDR